MIDRRPLFGCAPEPMVSGVILILSVLRYSVLRKKVSDIRRRGYSDVCPVATPRSEPELSRKRRGRPSLHGEQEGVQQASSGNC